MKLGNCVSDAPQLRLGAHSLRNWVRIAHRITVRFSSKGVVELAVPRFGPLRTGDIRESQATPHRGAVQIATARGDLNTNH